MTPQDAAITQSSRERVPQRDRRPHGSSACTHCRAEYVQSPTAVLILSDVESIVRDYHHTYYVPHNLTLIVTGKLASGTASLLDVVQKQVEPSIVEHGQNKGPRPEGWKRPFVETASAQRKPIPETIKETLIRAFRRETCSDSLRTFTCACCGGAYPYKQKLLIPLQDLPLAMLQCPEHWDDMDMTRDLFLVNGRPHFLLRNAVHIDRVDSSRAAADMCSECSRCLRRHKIPPLSFANHNFIGPVPRELQELTFIEEAIIARSRAKSWIVHLREDKDTDDTAVRANTQRGFKGHVIVYPQRPEQLATLLPPPIEDIITPICVIFVGSSLPTRAWLEEKAKPLIVRREKIRAALKWLQAHNPLYKDVMLDEASLNDLPAGGLLPYRMARQVGIEVLVGRFL